MAVFWQLVDWLSLPLLAVLAGVLVWRKTFREFPYFFYYVVCAEIVGVARLIVFYWGRSRLVYGYTYWISDVLITLFALLTTYELFLSRLFPSFQKTRFYRRLFPAVAVFLGFLAVPVALRTGHFQGFVVALHVLDFLRVGILIFFVVLMLVMGRNWTRSEFAIALGLAVQAAAMLSTFAVLTKDPRVHGFVAQLPTVAYDLACLIWLISFLRPEKQATVPTASVQPEVLEQAREWKRTLKDSLSGKKREP